MHKQFKKWLGHTPSLDDLRGLEAWQQHRIEKALYLAWQAGRRYQDEFREEELIGHNARIVYGIQMGD